ncbi:MAG: discoidin domain-containing protein, partial [Lachnospiraceae bacterium]|nr:discoidin domain-containing protein [Lachnospiraceae bacterium]
MDLDRVIEAESVENLTFKNNKVYRMNPDVEIDIALADTSISSGETAALDITATGNKNSGSIDNLFQFKACKNVVIEGNTYDDGLKLCAVVDQATINNGITVNDKEIKVGTSATAATEPVADIQFATTDASVATVDADGNITGVSEGTATVFAYYKWNDTIIRSNYMEIQVEGEFEGSGSEDKDDQEPVVTYELNPAFQIVRGNDNHSYDAESIEITSEAGDLYQSDNTLNNLFLYTPDVDRSNLRASVKVEGLPIRENGKWDTASFILMSGEDDYYTIGKKSHYDGFSTVKERAQSALEAGGNSADNSVESAWLGIVKTGNEIKLEYSTDGTTWETAQTYTDDSFGNNYQLGFGSWTSTNSGRKATFSEFKVGTADQSYADLEAVEILTASSEVVPEPDVSDVFVAFGTEIVFEENDAEDVTVSIPMEVQKVEMTYAFDESLASDVKISQNGTALEGNFSNAGSVVLEIADGDKIVITHAGTDYTFTIKCVAENVTTVEKIAIEALGFEAVPSNEDAFFVDAGYQGKGTVEVTADAKVGTVEVLYGNLRTPLAVTAEGNTYSVDYSLVDGLNSFYVQSIAKDGVTTKQYIINLVYDAPAEPAVVLSNTTAGDLKAGAVVGELAVVGVEESETYTFEFSEGNGDADNNMFKIVDGQLKVKKALTDGESYQIRVRAVSGEASLEASFVIKALRTRTDYPVENLTAISDSQYLPGTSNEGPDDFILDGDASTHWHTNWATTEGTNVEKRWIGVSLDEATEIDGIRYLPRTNGGNGAVTEYIAQYRETDDGEWINLATGTWSANDTSWKLISFDAVVAKQVRIVGVHTYADSGNDAHMSTAEFRVTIAEEETDVPEEEEVIRLSGTTRYETGYKVADALKEELGVDKFDAVVVATGKNFADAL